MTLLVHILIAGRALCGRPGTPNTWDEDERWVGPDTTDDATCESCKTQLATAKRIRSAADGQ